MSYLYLLHESPPRDREVALILASTLSPSVGATFIHSVNKTYTISSGFFHKPEDWVLNFAEKRGSRKLLLCVSFGVRCVDSKWLSMSRAALGLECARESGWKTAAACQTISMNQKDIDSTYDYVRP